MEQGLWNILDFSGQRKDNKLNVGDLVTMDYSHWPEGDEWGVGLVVKIDAGVFYKTVVNWSKIGLSWEETDMLEVISASQ